MVYFKMFCLFWPFKMHVLNFDFKSIQRAASWEMIKHKKANYKTCQIEVKWIWAGNTETFFMHFMLA